MNSPILIDLSIQQKPSSDKNGTTGVSEFSFVERRPQETDGECKIDVRLQDEGESLDGVPPWHPDDSHGMFVIAGIAFQMLQRILLTKRESF